MAVHKGESATIDTSLWGVRGILGAHPRSPPPRGSCLPGALLPRYRRTSHWTRQLAMAFRVRRVDAQHVSGTHGMIRLPRATCVEWCGSSEGRSQMALSASQIRPSRRVGDLPRGNVVTPMSPCRRGVRASITALGTKLSVFSTDVRLWRCGPPGTTTRMEQT